MRYGFAGKHPGFPLLSPGAGSTPAYRTSEAIPSRPRPRLWCRRGQLHSTDAARVGAHAALMYGAGLCSFTVFSPTGSVGSIPPCRANVPWTQRIFPGGDTHVQRSSSLQAMMVRFQVAQGARSWGRKKSDGVGSPERSPVSRSASIAVVTANQEAVFSVWQPGKTGIHVDVVQRQHGKEA